MKAITKAAEELLAQIHDAGLEDTLPASEKLQYAIASFLQSRARFAQLQTIRILRPFTARITVSGPPEKPWLKAHKEGDFERGDKATIIGRDDTTITCATNDPSAAVFTLQKEDENRIWEYCFKGNNYEN